VLEELENTKTSWKYPLLIASVLVLIINSIHFIQEMGWLYLNHHGMRPKNVEGLIGIITMPFLHSNWGHVGSNSTALFALSFSIFYFYKKLAWKSILFIVLVGGFWLWIAGDLGSNHVGASGLVYGLAAFLFTSGMIRKNKNLMGISLLVAFLYGSFFWGVLPHDVNVQKNISWEGHLFGALAGTAIAIYYRKDGPQRKIYQYEIDEMLEEQEQKRMEELQKVLEEQNANVRIVYHFKKQDSSDANKSDGEN